MENLEQRVTNIESALRSQGISIPDCAQLRVDVLGDEYANDGAIVIDGEPVVGVKPEVLVLPSESEYRAYLEGQPMDDLRAMANDLPISNMHDLDKPALIDQILVCLYGGVAVETEGSDGQA